MTKYKTVLKIIRTEGGGEIYQQDIVAESVVEQRVSHFIMGLAIIGTMTGPLLVVLHLIPKALFAGVFFVVGWGGLEGNGIMAKIIYLIREPRFIQPDEPLLRIPKTRIAFYLFWQLFGITATVGVSQTIAAIGMFTPLPPLIPTPYLSTPRRACIELSTNRPIHLIPHAGFPVLIIALIPLRWNLLPKMFSAKELRIMDAPTADNEVVLASMGGMPGSKDGGDTEMDGGPGESREVDVKAEEEEEGKWAKEERGFAREERGRGVGGVRRSLTFAGGEK